MGRGSPLSFSTSVGAGAGPPGTPGRGSPLRLVNGVGDEGAMSPNAFVSRPSVKKLVIDRKALGDSFLASSKRSPEGGPPKSKDSPASGGRAKVSFNPELELPTRDRALHASSSTHPDEELDFTEATPVKKSAGSSANLGEESGELRNGKGDWPPRRHATARALKHGEYYTKPSLETLQKLPASALHAVEDLVVGRVGYGEVAFQEPVDLTTISSVEDLLGGIVVLEDRNASVYAGDYEEDKPAPGQGLNVPAVITLEHCHPLDKATRKPIKDPDHPRLVQHIKRLKSLEDTNFIDFDVAEGRWTFRVVGF